MFTFLFCGFSFLSLCTTVFQIYAQTLVWQREQEYGDPDPLMLSVLLKDSVWASLHVTPLFLKNFSEFCGRLDYLGKH